MVWRPSVVQVLGDPLHLGQKAHVQHPVGFVQDERLDFGQVHIALLQMVEQPARRGDDDVHAAPQLLHLLGHARAAVDGRARAGRCLCRRGANCVFDLDGQFAGRDEDQGARVAAVAVLELVEDGQGEDGGLAAAGLGAGDQVPAAQGGGQGQRLDLGGGDVAGGGEVLLDASRRSSSVNVCKVCSFSSSACRGRDAARLRVDFPMIGVSHRRRNPSFHSRAEVP